MKTIDRLTRARIQIQKSSPFFAYLSLFLKIQEGKDLPDHAGAGVNAQGDFFYKESFFEKLNDDEVEGVVIHEILHLALLHLMREGARDHELFNISADVCVNQIIKDNGYKLPDGCIISDSDNCITLFNKKIKDCDKKNAEQIYDELLGNWEKIKGKEREDAKGFDEHIQGKGDGKGKNGKPLTEKEIKELSKEWTDRLVEAYTSAKLRGKVPLGIERLIGKLHESKINWKVLLYRYITSYFATDYTYARPNKKSISAGYYMPDYTKEKIDVVVGVDLSGSIGTKEITDFISEIIGIAKGFQDKCTIRFLTHDVEVQNDYIVANGNLEKIRNLDIKGGGGTSHIPIFKYIDKNIKDCKVAIFFTDGYSDLEEIEFNKHRFQSIFLISKDGNDNQIKGRAKTIKL